VKSPYDDPILKQYEAEFISDFNIIDEDAEFTGYNLEQQLFIDEYLDRVVKLLDSHTDENNKEQIKSINKDISELRKRLTVISKKQTIEALAKIWAKSRKIGFPIIKEIYIQVRNEIIKQLVQGQLGL
jgi:hypothetical protein